MATIDHPTALDGALASAHDAPVSTGSELNPPEPCHVSDSKVRSLKIKEWLPLSTVSSASAGA